MSIYLDFHILFPAGISCHQESRLSFYHQMAYHFGASGFDTLRGAAPECLIAIRCEEGPQPLPSNFGDGQDDPSCQAMPPNFNIETDGFFSSVLALLHAHMNVPCWANSISLSLSSSVGSLVICEDEPSIPSLNEEWKWEREEKQKGTLSAPIFATGSEWRSDQRPQSSSAPIRPDQQGADSEMCYSTHGRMGQTSTMAAPSRRKYDFFLCLSPRFYVLNQRTLSCRHDPSVGVSNLPTLRFNTHPLALRNSSSSPRSRPAHVRNPHALSSDARSHQTQQTHRSDRNAGTRTHAHTHTHTQTHTQARTHTHTHGLFRHK